MALGNGRKSGRFVTLAQQPFWTGFWSFSAVARGFEDLYGKETLPKQRSKLANNSCSYVLLVPVLIGTDTKKRSVIHTDASEVGAGATLSQLDDERIHYLIECRFKKRNS